MRSWGGSLLFFTPMPVLRNPKHEKFAIEVAKGTDGAKAYKKHVSGGKCSQATAEVTASKMLKTGSKVALRVAELREASDKKANDAAILELSEAKVALSKMFKGKPMDVSHDNPLCEMKMSKAGPYYAFPDKLGALDRLAKMNGWYKEEEVKVTVPGLAELLGRIVKPGVPREGAIETTNAK